MYLIDILESNSVDEFADLRYSMISKPKDPYKARLLCFVYFFALYNYCWPPSRHTGTIPETCEDYLSNTAVLKHTRLLSFLSYNMH